MYLLSSLSRPGPLSPVTHGLQMSGLLCAVCDRRVVAAPAPSAEAAGTIQLLLIKMCKMETS